MDLGDCVAVFSSDFFSFFFPGLGNRSGEMYRDTFTYRPFCPSQFLTSRDLIFFFFFLSTEVKIFGSCNINFVKLYCFDHFSPDKNTNFLVLTDL